MVKFTERTSFTKDVEGRYLCNDVSEVNAWTSAGGRPFDVIVVGGGTFGSAIAEHIWFRQKQVGGGLRYTDRDAEEMITVNVSRRTDAQIERPTIGAVGKPQAAQIKS